MGKKILPYNQMINLLQELKKDYPTYTFGQHISTALMDYRDIWGLTDKEFLFALEKYRTELEFNIVPEKEIERIITDAKNLDTIFQEEEDDYDN